MGLDINLFAKEINNSQLQVSFPQKNKKYFKILSVNIWTLKLVTTVAAVCVCVFFFVLFCFVFL